MTDIGQPIPSPFPIRQSLAAIAAAWASVAAASIAVLLGIGHMNTWPIVVTCGMVCGIASVVALLPMMMMAGHSPEAAAQGALVGVMIRMFVTLAGAAMIVALSPWPLEAVAGWTIGWYLLLLAVEVSLIVRYFHAAHQTAHTTEGSACSAR